jgi:soluble lytic murein transglycosylase
LRAPPSTAKAATLRLYDELPEQPRGEVIDDGAMTPPRRIARATVLERLQRNAEVVDVVGDLVDEDCEAALLVAKAKRKLRRYAESRQALAHATHDRCGEIQKKARYLELRVASIQKGDSVESLATSFLKRWGRDPLADDVLLWVAETRAARGDEPGRDEALARIVSDFPDGDMAEDARFRLALAAALRGETARATTMLDDAVAAHTERRRTRIIDRDRARYWRARLAVAPDPRSLNVVADETTAQAGWTALATFARERGASFYGQLARRLLHSAPAAKDGADHAADPAGEARATIPDDAAVGVPAALGADRRFALALTALQAGFDDEAATLLVDVVSDTAFAGDRAAVLAVAAAFVTAGRPDRAHQTLRNAGFALLDGEPVGAGLPAWALAWPRAHAAALEEGATQGRIPPPLLFGIAREESAFDASVVSWAGAVGLCQLMPTTALDEARALKLPPPSTTDLLDPTLNARLGGAHLGRRLHGMKHPLLAIAAYNAGPGAVARWMPPEGQRLPADLFVEQIPVEETRNYVKKVIGSWVTYAVLDGAGDAAVLDEGPLAFDIRIGR